MSIRNSGDTIDECFFGSGCTDNKFFGSSEIILLCNSSIGNIFDNNQEILFKKDYTQNVRCETGNKLIELSTTLTPTQASPLQNIILGKGLLGNIQSTMHNYVQISHPTIGDNYQTTYQPGNSQIININLPSQV